MNAKETQQSIAFGWLDQIQCITDVRSMISDRLKASFQKFISRLPFQQSTTKAIKCIITLLHYYITVQQWLLLSCGARLLKSCFKGMFHNMSNTNELQGVQKNIVSSLPAFPHGWRELGWLRCKWEDSVTRRGKKEQQKETFAALTHAEGLQICSLMNG